MSNISILTTTLDDRKTPIRIKWMLGEVCFAHAYLHGCTAPPWFLWWTDSNGDECAEWYASPKACRDRVQQMIGETL